MENVKKKITYEAFMHNDGTVSLVVNSSNNSASFVEIMGCLEMIKQAVILSNKEFKQMYETIKVKTDDSESSTGTSSSGGESTQH